MQNSIMKFYLKKKDGYVYAKKSGDFNKIHLDPLEGYNSVFGKNICHGTLVINKFLNKIKINKILSKKKNFQLNFDFQKPFEYDKTIYISKSFKKIYQKNSGLLYFDNVKQNNVVNFNSRKVKSKKFKVCCENLDTKLDQIMIMLSYLSRYVGMFFPGKYSIIKNIDISYDIKNNFKSNFILIKSIDHSKKPIVYNKLCFGKYLVYFITLKRPKLILKTNKLKSNLIKIIKTINENILIIGSSSGIGLELLRIFENNSKVKIFATYFRNKISSNKKNVFFIKLDVNKNLKKIGEIIKNNKKLRIFYMATPKINIKNNYGSTFKVYKKFYLENVLKILSFSKNCDIKFFYPSTTAINNFQSNYTRVKLLSEKKLNALKQNNIKINILRISEINTKQTLSIFNSRITSFTKQFNLKKEYQKKILFL